MELSTKHFGEPYAVRGEDNTFLGGQVHNFFATDSEENWNRNEEKLLRMGYTKDYLNYDLNEQGFRMFKSLTDEFNDPIVCIGDSSTFGNGIRFEDIWINFLKEEGDIINLGSQGAGFITIYRLLKAWLPVIKPKAVYMAEPIQKRPEFYSGIVPHIIGENARDMDKDFWKEYLNNDRTEGVYRSLCLDAIKNLVKELGIRLYFLETPWDTPIFGDHGWRRNMFLTKKYVMTAAKYNSNHDQVGQIARDLLHPGSDIHAHIAQEFNHMFDNNLLYGS